MDFNFWQIAICIVGIVVGLSFFVAGVREHNNASNQGQRTSNLEIFSFSVSVISMMAGIIALVSIFSGSQVGNKTQEVTETVTKRFSVRITTPDNHTYFDEEALVVLDVPALEPIRLDSKIDPGGYANFDIPMGNPSNLNLSTITVKKNQCIFVDKMVDLSPLILTTETLEIDPLKCQSEPEGEIVSSLPTAIPTTENVQSSPTETLLPTLFTPTPPSLEEERLIPQPKLSIEYWTDFEYGIEEAESESVSWNSGFITNTFHSVYAVNQTSYLGLSESVELALRNPHSTHTNVKLEFDLYIVRTWDGNEPNYGPDRFIVRSSSGIIFMDTTFSNVHEDVENGPFYQSFPEFYNPKSPANYLPMEGSIKDKRNTLGYSFGGNRLDSTYRLSVEFTMEPDERSMIYFESLLVEPGGSYFSNESWGLDNVSITFK